MPVFLKADLMLDSLFARSRAINIHSIVFTLAHSSAIGRLIASLLFQQSIIIGTQWPKNRNIQWLKTMSSMCRQKQKNNIMVVSVINEFNADMAIVAIPLQAASSGGYDKVVQMLMDAGADVNAQGGGYGNALQAASERGHEKVVQMLIDAGAVDREHSIEDSESDLSG